MLLEGILFFPLEGFKVGAGWLSIILPKLFYHRFSLWVFHMAHKRSSLPASVCIRSTISITNTLENDFDGSGLDQVSNLWLFAHIWKNMALFQTIAVSGVSPFINQEKIVT